MIEIKHTNFALAVSVLFVLHNYNLFANTFCVVIAIIFIILIIICLPIKFKLRAMLSIAEKKLYYSIAMGKLVKLNSGYVDFNNASIKLFYKNSKVKFLTANDLFLNESTTNFLKHFNIVKLSSAILLGEDAGDLQYFLCPLINSLNKVTFSVLSQAKPYTRFKNDVFILGSESSSGALAKIEFVTNVLSIIALGIKKLIDFIKNKTVKEK